MEEIFGIVGIPAITVICFLAGQAVKATKLANEFIPVVCGALGGLLGIAALFVMPEFPAGDYITAAAIGIASGFAATGVNEAVKQLAGK